MSYLIVFSNKIIRFKTELIFIKVNDTSKSSRYSSTKLLKDSVSNKNDKSLLHNYSVSIGRSEDIQKNRQILERERENSALKKLIQKNERINSKLNLFQNFIFFGFF